MMEYKIMIQGTPNPNALKFVVNAPVKNSGNVTYRNAEDCHKNPLARKIFSIAHISEVYFFDNYITVTQDGNADWDTIEEQIKTVILENIAEHDPNFETQELLKKTPPPPSDPELIKIDAIINKTVRPYLQMDGGDLQLISLEDNVLRINYQGACGSCPSSAMGTLKAIENLLRDEYNPEITVELAQ